MDTLEKRLKRIVMEKFRVSESAVSLETCYARDLHADSLDIVELVMLIEAELGIELIDEETAQMTTVGDTLTLLTEAIADRWAILPAA